MESSEWAVHEHCRTSEGFLFTQKQNKGGATSKVDSVKCIAARRQAVRQLLDKKYEV